MDNISDALENWARWLRSRTHAQTCNSAEGEYRRRPRADDTGSGWGDWDVTPPARNIPNLDLHAALAVERVMPFIPDKNRKALRLHYVDRRAPRQICQRLALRFIEWDDFLLSLQNIVKNRLRMELNGSMVAQRPLMPLSSDDIRASTARLPMAKAA